MENIDKEQISTYIELNNISKNKNENIDIITYFENFYNKNYNIIKN